MYTENQSLAEGKPVVGHSEKKAVIERMLLSMMIFFGAASVVLGVSYMFVLPQLTSVDIAGVSRDASSLSASVSSLDANVQALVQQREELITPLRGTLYGALRSRKMQRPSFALLRSSIQHAASTLVPGRNDVVFLDSVTYHLEEGVVDIQGSIQHVGPSAMTYVAQFVDACSAVPNVQSVDPPRFERKRDTEGNFYAPFSFRLHVQ